MQWCFWSWEHFLDASNEVPIRTKNPFGKSETLVFRACETYGANTELCLEMWFILELCWSARTRLDFFGAFSLGRSMRAVWCHFEVPRESTKISEIERSRVVSQRVETVVVCVFGLCLDGFEEYT